MALKMKENKPASRRTLPFERRVKSPTRIEPEWRCIAPVLRGDLCPPVERPIGCVFF